MEIRLLKPEEYEKAHALIKERADWMEPPKSGLVGQFENGELVGIGGIQQVPVFEPLVMKNGHSPERLIAWIDGKLDPLRYFWFIRDERFQHLVDIQYADNLEGWVGKLYVRKR